MLKLNICSLHLKRVLGTLLSRNQTADYIFNIMARKAYHMCQSYDFPDVIPMTGTYDIYLSKSLYKLATMFVKEPSNNQITFLLEFFIDHYYEALCDLSLINPKLYKSLRNSIDIISLRQSEVDGIIKRTKNKRAKTYRQNKD